MLVIGDRSLRFRVNAKPTASGAAQENYGLIHDLSAIPPVPAGARAAERNAGILRGEIPSAEDRACDMANKIFPRLPCRRRFESMPAPSKTRHWRGHSR
jgi:hypothetical protein